MIDYIEAYKSILSEGQQDALEGITRKMLESGEIQSEREFKKILEINGRDFFEGQEYKSSFTPRLVPNPRTAKARVSSQDINQNNRDILIHLTGLYRHLLASESTIRQNDDIITADLTAMKAGIAKLKNDLRIFQFLKNNPEYTFAIFNDFADLRNEASVSAATVDERTKKLELPLDTEDRYAERRGSLATKVSTTVLTKGGTSGGLSKDFGPDNIIDSNIRTFWGDLFLSDDRASTDYRGTLYDGVITKISIKFAQTEEINNCRFFPFAEFPLQVIDVRYREHEVFKQIPNFTNDGATLDWIEWDFPFIETDEIQIFVLQENFIRRIYHIPKDLLFQSALWEQIADKQFEISATQQNLTQLQDQIVEGQPEFLSFVDGLNRTDQLIDETGNLGDDITVMADNTNIVDSISKVFTEAGDGAFSLVSKHIDRKNTLDATTQEDQIVQVEKFEYFYGAYTAETNSIEYVDNAVFRSQLYNANSSIVEIELDVAEEQISLTDDSGTSYNATSIEYSIETGRKKSFAILPFGTTTVNDELVLIDPSSRKGTVRFDTSDASPIVRANGAVVDGSSYTWTAASRLLEADTTIYRPTTRFTVTYTPDSGQDTLDFRTLINSEPIEESESFIGEENDQFITMQSFPTVNYEIINNEDLWDKDATDAVWTYDDADTILELDGVSYGRATTTLDGSITKTDDVITVVSTADFPDDGLLIIGSEQIYYPIKTATDFGTVANPVFRGANGTAPATHSDTTDITANLARTYSPITVSVDGTQAINITDYEKGEHPAFAQSRADQTEYQYIHAGRKVFLNVPLLGKYITVDYNRRVDFLVLVVRMYNHQVGRSFLTPKIVDYTMKLKTADI